MSTAANIEGNYEHNINILNENIKLYTKKINPVIKRIYDSYSLQCDDFFIKIMINIFLLSDKGLKNKFINIANAIQILVNLNYFDDKRILQDTNSDDNYQYIVTSQYFYSIALKLFYENCPETIGIFQKIMENKVHAELIKNKNKYNYKMTMAEYINQVNKKWGDFLELNSLIVSYLGKLNKDKTKIVKEFSRYVGIAYGIKQDILRIENNTKDGVMTIPIILLLSKAEEKTYIMNILKNKEKIDFNKIKIFLDKYNTILDTELIMKGYIEKALILINEIDGRQELKKIVYNYFVLPTTV